MSDVGKLLVGWMEGAPERWAETWAGLVRNHYCVSNHFPGRGLAEGRVWHRWARVKRHPRLVPLLIEHVLLLNVFAVLREHSRRRCAG
jgi:hypothetical protein